MGSFSTKLKHKPWHAAHFPTRLSEGVPPKNVESWHDLNYSITRWYRNSISHVHRLPIQQRKEREVSKRVLKPAIPLPFITCRGVPWAFDHRPWLATSIRGGGKGRGTCQEVCVPGPHPFSRGIRAAWVSMDQALASCRCRGKPKGVVCCRVVLTVTPALRSPADGGALSSPHLPPRWDDDRGGVLMVVQGADLTCEALRNIA
jgi:hypothetical protein